MKALEIRVSEYFGRITCLSIVAPKPVH